MKTENQLLLWFSNKYRCQPSGTELVDLLSGRVDWNELVVSAKRHRVAPLCHRFVEQLEERVRCLVPLITRLQFAHLYLASLVYTAVRYRELKRLAAAFDSDHLNVVLMKGLALGKLVYEDIALRPCGDLDLVVMPDQYERGKHVLSELGYRQTVTDVRTKEEVNAPVGFDRYWCRFLHHGMVFRRRAEIDASTLRTMVNDWSGGCRELQPFAGLLQQLAVKRLQSTAFEVAVELHVSFCRRFSAFFAHDDAFLHERTRLEEFDPTFNMRVLSPEDFLIFLCEHHVEEGTSFGSRPFLWHVCDVRETAIQFQASMSLPKLMITARHMGLDRQVSGMLYQARQLDVSGALNSVIPCISSDEADFLEVFHRNGEGDHFRWQTPYLSRLFESGDYNHESYRILKEHRLKTGRIRKVFCPKVVRPLDLDGCLSDSLWKSAGLFGIDRDETLEGDHVFLCVAGDMGKRVGVDGYVCWNEEFLFAAVVVKDDVVICSDPAAVGVFSNQDQVRFLFWIEDNPKIYALLLRPDLTDGAICVSLFGEEVVGCVQTVASIGNSQYVVEIALPFSELGVCPKNGMSIEFDVQIDDCDDAEMGVRKTLTWAGGNPHVPVPYGELCFVESM